VTTLMMMGHVGRDHVNDDGACGTCDHVNDDGACGT
jgi:hypothetical protein